MRPKWGKCMSLVYISNTVVSHFEELVMSLSAFNPSLCCLSPFYLVLCCCFMTILPVHKKFNISIMGLKSRKFWLKKWVTVDAPLISWGDTFIFKMIKKTRQMSGKSEMIRNFTVSPLSRILMTKLMKTQIIDIVDTLDNFEESEVFLIPN